MNRFPSIAVVAIAASLAAWSAPGVALAENKAVAVVSFSGYDALISDLNFLGEVSGMPQLGPGMEGLLAAVTGMKGLAGLDKTKPIGASISLEEGASSPVALIFVPVTNADKLLDALQGLIPEVKDLGDGYSQLRPINSPPVVMRTVGGWAFLTLSKDDLAELPDDPAALLGDLPTKYDLAVELNVKNVPNLYRKMAVDGISQGFSEGMRRLPDEDDSTYEARQKIGREMLDEVVVAMEELERITVGLAIDSKTRSVYLDASINMTAGGKLAAQFATIAQQGLAGKLAGFADPSAVVDLHFGMSLTADDERALVSLLETTRGEALKRIESEDSLDDPELKKSLKSMAGDVFDVLTATVKERQLNGGGLMQGNGPYEIALGAVVADGKKLERVVKQGIELLSQSPDFIKDDLEFDTAEGDGVTFHTVKFTVDDDEAAEFFGDELTVALGFGEKTVFLAAGQEPVVTTSAILARSKLEHAKLPPMLLQLQLGPIMTLAAKTDDRNKEVAEMMAAQLSDSDNGHINVTSEFIPNGTRLRIELEEDILGAFGKTVQAMPRGRR